MSDPARPLTSEASRPAQAFVVALLGAESTGKSTLAQALAGVFVAEGHPCMAVDETLRSFCDALGRTPRVDEQQDIAAAQTARIEAAAAAHALVFADTTALMTAVYSDLIFDDHTLYPSALEAQRRVDLTLVMALDLPWEADGLQRDGPQVQAPVDQRVRAALHRAGLPYQVIAGRGEARLARAVDTVRRALVRRTTSTLNPAEPRARPWRHVCGRCGDPGCERHLFTALQGAAVSSGGVAADPCV